MAERAYRHTRCNRPTGTVPVRGLGGPVATGPPSFLSFFAKRSEMAIVELSN